MKSYTTSAMITAAPATIWKILTDAARYPVWDPWAIRIEGTIALEQKVTAYTKLSYTYFANLSKLDRRRTLIL